MIRLPHRTKLLLLTLLWLLSACRQPAPTPTPVAGEVEHDQIKLVVDQDGVYRVSLSQLQEAGLAMTELIPDQLHLSQLGTAVPFWVQDDTIIFYGQAATDRYTMMRPYLLQTGAKDGDTMAETAVAPAAAATATPATATPATATPATTIPQTLHIEENNKYLAETRQDEAGDTIDLWYWDTISQGKTLSLTLELAALSKEPATLRLQLWGKTHHPEIENDHDFDVVVNDQRVATIRWDGATAFQGEAEIPAGVLQEGENHIVLDNSVEGASFLDIMELNWLELDYTAPATAVSDRLTFTAAPGSYALSGFSTQPLLLDVTNPAAPQRLTNWEWTDGEARFHLEQERRIATVGPEGFRRPVRLEPVRQSLWRTADNQADLLIVTTDELAPALEPLVQAREEDGLAVAVIPVAEIYEAFAHGAPTPLAIQEFVRYAVENWREPAPRYLFLVGDATSDYRDYLGQRPHNVVPAPMVPVEYSGETVSDSRLADVDEDVTPELAVGRWPVSTVADVEDLVQRTLAYEAGTAESQALFAADGTEAQFAAIATRLWQESQFHDDNVTLLNGAPAEEVVGRWNEGAWLITYIGHGSVERWGKDNVFSLDAVGNLENTTTPPIVLQLTCLTGLFSHPTQTSLSEAMLNHEQGPVLLVAATSLTLSSHQEPFALSLLQNLQDPQVERIGDAFQHAKQSLDVENSGLREISDTFALLGDPSAHIVRPKP